MEVKITGYMPNQIMCPEGGALVVSLIASGSGLQVKSDGKTARIVKYSTIEGHPLFAIDTINKELVEFEGYDVT